MPPKKIIESSESEDTDIDSYDETDISSSDDDEDDDDDENVDEDNVEDGDDDKESKDGKKEKNDETDEFVDDCVFRFAKTNVSDDSDIDNSDGNISDDDDEFNTSEFVLPEERITKPFLSETEKTRLVLERRTQLTLGAKPMIKDLLNISIMRNPRDIALLELQHKVLPLKIIRILPSGKKELWMLEELEYI
jgi:hypothetical protein